MTYSYENNVNKIPKNSHVKNFFKSQIMKTLKTLLGYQLKEIRITDLKARINTRGG